VTSPLLACEDLCVAYGGAMALHSVSLRVDEGEIVAIIGANGAGKTTLLRTVAGLHKPTSGAIALRGAAIAGRPAHAIARDGISLIPEGRGLLPDLSVRDNLRLGSYLRGQPVAERMQQLREWFPVLFDRLDQPAGLLSGGEQQMLSVARSLLGEPRLLMVDELSLGLSPKVTMLFIPRLHDIRAQGTSVLLVDQSVQLALAVADRLYVLANGRIAWAGPPHEIGGDADMMSRYLGMG